MQSLTVEGVASCVDEDMSCFQKLPRSQISRDASVILIEKGIFGLLSQAIKLVISYEKSRGSDRRAWKKRQRTMYTHKRRFEQW